MEMHVGDLEPTLQVAITRENAAVDLTGVGVDLVATLDGTALFDDAATVTDAAGGVIERAWEAADTDTAGLVQLRVRLTHSGGRTETISVGETVRILP